MADLKDDPSRAAETAEILKALSHPARLQIVAQLCGREAHVSDLAASLNVPQALVSQQLRILRMSGLVEFRREAGFAVYRLAKPHLVDLLHCLENCRSDGK